MRKILLMAAALATAAVPLAGCSTLGALATNTSPAPLNGTSVDDTVLSATWQAFDGLLDVINLLRKPEVPANMRIVDGTPKAKAIAAAIRKVTAALQAAERLDSAGSSTSLMTALGEAKAGIVQIRNLLKGE